MIAKTEQLVNLKLADVQSVRHPVIVQHDARLDILRLDKIHPTISGNKWFKLKHNLQEAIAQNKESIITIGGAYSNHILATAAACKELGLKSFGLIKGDKPAEPSCTLQAAIEWGMQIDFKPRSFFQQPELLNSIINEEYPDSYLVEEGGRNDKGILGAEEILRLVNPGKYRYICCSIGTGTMMAGIVNASENGQKVIGLSSLKILDRENELSRFLETKTYARKNYEIIYDYHFGGYARYSEGLIQFMNDFNSITSIPTDIVYTAKLIYGTLDLIKSGYFEPQMGILVIHSGGLQGNCSLPPGTLLF